MPGSTDDATPRWWAGLPAGGKAVLLAAVGGVAHVPWLQGPAVPQGWLAAGVLLPVLLWARTRREAVVMTAAVALSMLAGLLVADGDLSVIGIGSHLTQLAGAAVAAVALRAVTALPVRVDRVSDCARLFAGTALGAGVHGGFVLLEGGTWYVAWAGTCIGLLLPASVLLSLAHVEPRMRLLRRLPEAIAMVTVTVAVIVVVFGRSPAPQDVSPVWPFMLFPSLMWVAIRFGPVGQVLMTFSSLTAVLVLSTYGHGPFWAVSQNQVATVFALQMFILTVYSLKGLLSALERTEDDSRRELQGSERRALEGERGAQEASARATLLSDVAAALAESATVAQVTDAIVTRVRGAVEAHGVVVAAAEETSLRVIRAAGYEQPGAGYAEGSVLPAEHPLATVAARAEAAYAETPEEVRALLPVGVSAPEAEGDYAAAFLPLIVSGRPIGSMVIVFIEPHTFDEEERLLLGTLAGHCAQALERARLFQREQNTAISLQRALLPSDVSKDPRLPVAARYLPAETGVEIGGDFYDIIPLPSGTIALILGDVAGHNIAAAAVMGQVRNAIRAYALDGHSPSGVMERTNRMLAAVEQERLTTCAYVEICPDQAALTLVLAGHPPPVVREPGMPARLLDAAPSPPLGVDPAARFQERTYLLQPDSLLLLYSDGLVETRQDQLDTGLQRLVAAASDLPDDPQSACERILSEVANAAVDDDIALLIARTSGAGARDSITRTFPCDPLSAPSARRFVDDVLAAWDLPTVIDSAELVISELCTNAVIHTSEEFSVDVRRETIDLVRLEVTDHSERVPTWTDPDALDDESIGGRGLHIVGMLAEEWGVIPDPNGKRVYATLRV